MRRPHEEPPAAEITPEGLWLRRRDLLKNAALFGATAAGVGGGLLALLGGPRGKRERPSALPPGGYTPAPEAPPSPLSTLTDPPTPWESVTGYNNFYELGLRKTDPAENAASLRTRPWTVAIEGEVKAPRTVDIDTLVRWFSLEERVYRMRCVETWSMVVPWLGFPLAELIRRVEPTSRARYVAFTTLHDPERLLGQKAGVLAWPYVEGLRIDEATHPLTLLAVGLYGKTLPGQNGAPIRLVVPWKYGFKGIKSIVKITFTERLPVATWNQTAPGEYGFFANVNPDVPHPRWSQATERRLGELSRRPTLPFNGYADQVASLYAGMDLRRDY